MTALRTISRESSTDFADPEALYQAELAKIAEHTDRLKTEMENIYDLTSNFASDLDGSKGLAVFGPPGVGKTKMVTQALIDANASVEYHKGADMSAPGLYGLLWFNRNPHRVLVLDDVDLNKGGQDSKAIIALLKSATENTYKPREVSWIKAAPNAQMREHNIPSKFEYWGNIIWITNDRPEDLLKKQSTAKHFMALVGEGGRFTPAILDWNKKDKYLWTKYLIEDCEMLGEKCESRRGGYNEEIVKDVLKFFKDYYLNLVGITPRYATKVAHNRFRFPDKWIKMSLLANSIGDSNVRK
jgi:RecA/RadA recombinase